ncbi:helix-turn-helix domain-containing protein [Pseudonocardia sp. RS11V-5]|uniref:PucR family transcriptional regulator n=1 Tax=Pseudonocardia terrae TaxID=2905831 RepID=UPI001E40DDD0|nr:helix-turn-helix domain-containing protein [Pseudonocardia terrae]MCE3550861.1 helix-turn-helix domain-containing protein [Pseudonocardia terrae]
MSRDTEVTALFDAMAERTAELTTHIVGRIRAEVPGYEKFPYPEHHRDVQVGVVAILAGLRERRPPTAAAIAHTRGMGRRRALFPVALTASIEAYHISYREIWAELLRRAQQHEPDLTGELVGTVALLWTWVHRFSAAFADAHAEETRVQAASMLALRRRFIDALARDGAASEAAFDAALALGFEPTGEFLVACSTSRGEVHIEQTNVALEAGPGVGHCAAGEAGQAIVVAQGIGPDDLVGAVRAGEPTAAVGLAAPGSGLRTAASCIVDAAEALATARPGEVVDFRKEWPSVILGRARARLRPVLEGGAGIARDNPALADTVRGFAAHRYSVSACARALHIHPNTAKYRLERWHALTGWDVYTVPGLLASLTCLILDDPDST